MIDIARLMAMNDARGTDSHHSALGIAYHSHGDDWAMMTLAWRPELVGVSRLGLLASGPIISLMDGCCGLAVAARRDGFQPMVTLDLRVDYLRPAEPHRTVTGRAECYRLTRQIAFVRGSAHDGDPARPVANVAGTFMLTDAT